MLTRSVWASWATTGAPLPETLEGQIVRKSDQIAYVNHDIDDAIRAGILTNEDIPDSISDLLGHTHRERVNSLVVDCILTSGEAGGHPADPRNGPGPEGPALFLCLSGSTGTRSPRGEESKAKEMLLRLYDYYFTNPQALPETFQPQMSFDGLERTVCDYIAGMTDNYAVDKYTEILFPWVGKSGDNVL